MRTHLFSTAITTKAAVTAAVVVLIGGGAALADTHDPEPLDDEEVEDADDDGDAYALGRDDGGQEARTTDFCKIEESGSPRCGDDEDGTGEEDLGLQDAVETEDDGERSETAERVHRALTGLIDDEVLDEGESFGQRVSSRARSGEPGALGELVSRSARGGDDVPDNDELTLEERESPGKGNADAEEAVADTSADDEDETGGPPPYAKAHGLD